MAGSTRSGIAATRVLWMPLLLCLARPAAGQDAGPLVRAMFRTASKDDKALPPREQPD